MNSCVGNWFKMPLTDLLSCSVAFDLPQRPNEAHIFYGNMSKIVVSVLGSAKSTCEQDEHAEVPPPSARRSSQTDGY